MKDDSIEKITYITSNFVFNSDLDDCDYTNILIIGLEKSIEYS